MKTPLPPACPAALADLAHPPVCLFSPHAVRTAISKMASAITDTLADTRPLVLCVLHGGILLTGQLLPQLPFPLQLNTLHATRYCGNQQGQTLHWHTTPSCSLAKRHVLLVDDILDKGITLQALCDFCYEKGAKQVHTAVLADKKTQRHPQGLQQADFTALHVPDTFIIGHGMDYQEYGRNTLGIYTI